MASGQEVMQMLMTRGMSPIQAAALAGHMQQESSFNPEAFNPKEGAFGALQWRLDRRDNLNKFAEQRGATPSDLNTQLDFILHEMSGPESKAGASFLAGKDLPSVHDALKRYIRYGDNSDATRMANATSLLGGAPGAAAAGAAAVPAAAPFALAPTAESANPAGAKPVAAMAAGLGHQQQQQQDEPIQMFEMAKPLGLAKVRELLAIMNRQRG